MGLTRDLFIRRATETELPAIVATWLTTYRDAPFSIGTTDAVFNWEQGVLVRDLMARSEVAVVAFASAPDVQVGWVVFEVPGGRPVVHYAYVDEPFRRRGVLRRILRFVCDNSSRPSHLICTHYTPEWYTAMQLITVSRPDVSPRAWLYNPWLCRYAVPEKEPEEKC